MKNIKQLAVSLAFLTGISATPVYAELPKPADSFVDAVGVNIHLHYTNTPYYSHWTEVRLGLEGLGVRHVRDGLIPNPGSFYYQRLSTLAAAGIKSDLITALNEPTSVISTYTSMIPGTIEYIEAPNECDLNCGSNWASALDAYLPTLQAGSQGIPIIGPSLTTDNAYVAVGNISSYVNYGNNHNYFADRNPGTAGWGNIHPCGVYATITFDMCIAHTATPNTPLVATETGYQDTPNDLPSDIKVEYTVRSLLEMFNAGYTKIYLYEFLDQSNQTYGLLDSSAKMKPAYYGVKSLLGVLSDPGSSITPVDLAWTITAPSSIHHTLLQRHDGSYNIVLWNEVSNWNASTHTAISVSPIQVNLSLPTGMGITNAGTIDSTGSLASSTYTQTGNTAYSLSVGTFPTILTVQNIPTP